MTKELRLADHAYAGIVEIIKNNGLDRGSRLPSEVQLAGQFGISRNIVREALVRLAADGITESRRGAGSYVRRKPSDLLGSHMPMNELSTTLGTYEVRLVLESAAAKLAALRRSAQQMDAIERALDGLLSALHSIGPAHDEDWVLHRAIMLATSNSAFVSTFDHLHEEIDRILRAGVQITRSRPPEILEAMAGEHEMIVDAIRGRDPDAAALAMRWHLTQGRKRLMP